MDIHAVPSDFDQLVDWLENWSYRLVLLEEYSLVDLRSAIDAVASAVHAHRAAFDRKHTGKQVPPDRVDALRIILSDHAWFETSVEQFWWFFRIVARDDHGGHRQALGQYGRVLAEALRRHRGDERALETAAGGPSGGPDS